MGAPRILVITPSLPEREAFRSECVASVVAQTLHPVMHVVGVDYERVGVATMLNRLASIAKPAGRDWIAQLADDDLMYPHHLETLASRIDDADIIYSWCKVTGRGYWNPNSHFDADRLRRENYIPATTLIRTTLIEALGGWREGVHGFEDWDFWLRALDAGARFACIPTVTWCYRFHSSNASTGR